MAPHWFDRVARAALGLGFASALVVAADIFLLGNRQHVVWPLTALYMGALALWLYRARGRRVSNMQMHARRMLEREARDSWRQTALSDTHCGAGCALGDIGGEWLAWATAKTIGSTDELGVSTSVPSRSKISAGIDSSLLGPNDRASARPRGPTRLGVAR